MVADWGAKKAGSIPSAGQMIAWSANINFVSVLWYHGLVVPHTSNTGYPSVGSIPSMWIIKKLLAEIKTLGTILLVLIVTMYTYTRIFIYKVPHNMYIFLITINDSEPRK